MVNENGTLEQRIEIVKIQYKNGKAMKKL